MFEQLRSLTSRRDEEGASAVEYGLLVAAIAAIVVAIVFLLGGVVSEVFSDTCTAVKDQAKTTAACSSPAPAAPAQTTP